MSALHEIFDHDATSPWTFLNGSFWLFCWWFWPWMRPCTATAQRGMRHLWLLAASLLFYWKTSGGSS